MFKFNLQHFAAGNVVNTSVGTANANTGTVAMYPSNGGLSGEMKTYYSDYLIDMAEPKLVHDQFGQKCPIPKGSGKRIEFRKYDPLPKMTTPLAEGVTPDGQKLNMGVVTAEVKQYGGFIELSDILLLTAIDNNLVQATKLLGAQAGRTLDTITREVLAGGTNVQYAEGQVSSRRELVGGKESGNHYLTVDAVRRAVRYLKNMNAETINGSYVGIIHPDTAYDLMSDPKWINVKTYSDPEGIYQGEIGKIENVRFVETSEAKVYQTEGFTASAKSLSVESYEELPTAPEDMPAKWGTGSYYCVKVKEELKESDASRIVGKKVFVTCPVEPFETIICGFDPVNSYIYLTYTYDDWLDSNTKLHPVGAGSEGRDVYSTIIFGENAYGTTEIAGGGLEHIVKQIGSAGAADPLNQRGSCGWKATKAAVRLVEPYMIRIETASTFNN